jgi:hypothetical protein
MLAKQHILGRIDLTLLIVCFLFSCEKPVHRDCFKKQQVVGSQWMSAFTNNQSLWQTAQQANGKEIQTCEFKVPEITEELLVNSAVLVYAKFYGYEQSIWPDEKVGLLPVEIWHTVVGGSLDQWNAAVEPGKATVTLKNTSGKALHYIDDKIVFRLIVIPKSALIVDGTKPVGDNPLGQYTEGELRTLSYDEICRTAGLSK